MKNFQNQWICRGQVHHLPLVAPCHRGIWLNPKVVALFQRMSLKKRRNQFLVEYRLYLFFLRVLFPNNISLFLRPVSPDNILSKRGIAPTISSRFLLIDYRGSAKIYEYYISCAWSNIYLGFVKIAPKDCLYREIFHNFLICWSAACIYYRSTYINRYHVLFQTFQIRTASGGSKRHRCGCDHTRTCLYYCNPLPLLHKPFPNGPRHPKIKHSPGP